MRRLIGVAVLAAGLAPVAVQAGAFDGVYTLSQCENTAGLDTIAIIGGEVTFYETICDLSSPVAVRGMEGTFLYDAECSGEGESWKARFLLMPESDGGLILVQSGFASTYLRCK